MWVIFEDERRIGGWKEIEIYAGNVAVNYLHKAKFKRQEA